MKHDQIPGAASVPPEWKDAVLHARIALGDTVIMASDVQPGNYQPMRSAYLSLGVTSDAEAERIHAALAEGGKIFMPMQETLLRLPLFHAARQVRHQLDGHPREAHAQRSVNHACYH
jgi:uncharacterized glyoxalase superfamily protein PhnB